MRDTYSLPDAGQPGALPQSPITGLIGRTRETAELETLLSADRVAPVWLTGYEGVGKTALICETARKLLASGRFERVVYTSFGLAGITEAALYDLGQSLIGPDFKLSTDSLPRIEETLSSQPTLIIWDDVGSVLYGGSQALDQPALLTWYQTANRIATQGGSALCLISDGIELPPSSRRLAAVKEYQVSTLADDAAVALGLALDQAMTKQEPRSSWQQLVQWLGGNPLALRCLSAARGELPLDSVSADLLARAPGLQSGEGRFRNRALEVALDQLVGTLSEALRERLPDLGIFVGGFVQNLGAEVLEITREQWVDGSTPLGQAGLVWDEPAPVLTIPVVRFHPALERWAGRRLGSERRAELAAAHYSHYFGFVSWIFRSASALQERGPRLFYREIGNVRRGLASILASGEVSVAINYIQVYNALLKELGFEQESTRATDAVSAATQTLLPQEGPWTQTGVEIALKQAEAFMSSGDGQKAGSLLSQLAVRFERPDGVDYKGQQATLDHVRVLVDLARVLRSTQHADVAVRSLNEALDLLDPFDVTEGTRTRRAEIYSDLLEIHLQLGQIEDAASACQRGLSALGDLDSPQLRANLHTRAAFLAVRQNDLDKAREELLEAATIMTANGDLAGLAAVENQLATLDLRSPDGIPSAMEHLGHAIGYAREGGQWLVEAQLHSQRSQLAVQQRDSDTAENELREAVAIYESNGAAGLLTMARATLAELLLRLSRPEEAQSEAELALVAGRASGQSIPWELYLLLQRIATVREDEADQARWRALTTEAYGQSPAAAAVVNRFTPLFDALARASQGEAMDTDAAEMLESMENNAQTKALAQSLWRVLSGERGEILFGELDHVGTAVVRALLQRLDNAPDDDASIGDASEEESPAADA